MATIGRSKALADALGARFTGLPAYLMWGFVHVLYLIGWGSRLGTLYAWLRSLTFSANRGYRVITQQNAQHELTRGTQDAHVNDAGGRFSSRTASSRRQSGAASRVQELPTANRADGP
jgi:hypothetical protein